jgi:spermidine synthase
VLAWALITTIVVMPAAIISGFQFPLLVALLGRGRAGVGREVGLTYAANTLGAIVGSLAGGFGVLPALGALGAWRLAGGLLLVLAAAAVALRVSRARAFGSTLAAAVLLLALGVPCLRATGPTAVWRHAGVGAGRARDITTVTTRNALVAATRARNRAILWEREGVESSVAIAIDDGMAFFVNGKSDGNSLGDGSTQVMGGLLGAASLEAPSRALVIGLGTGSTAGWLAQVSTMQRVDVAEIEPVIVDVARVCHEVNRDVLDNPKVKVHFEDARELMLSSKDTYDIIFSEPSNPYRAGIASLYTREFYEATRAHLSQGGVLLQWLQGYEVDAATVRSVLVTLGSVYPSVEVWFTQQRDLVLMASAGPRKVNADALRARLATEPYRTALRAVWHGDGLETYLSHFVAGDAVVRALSAAAPDDVNTDDLNVVEFGFARSVGKLTPPPDQPLRELGLRLGADRPEWIEGTVDWVAVAENRASSQVADRRGLLTGEARARAETYLGDPAVAARAWSETHLEPRTPLQRSIVAFGLANRGDEAALTLAQGLDEGWATERSFIIARTRLRQGRLAESVDAVLAGLTSLERSLWVLDAVEVRATLEALALALRPSDAAQMDRLADAIKKPLPSYRIEEARRATLFLLQRRRAVIDCVSLYAPLEPYTPWQRATLEGRARCYRQANDPRAALAQQEFDQFLEGEPARLLQFDAAPEPQPGGSLDGGAAAFAPPEAPVGGSADVDAGE